jgi:hypothetical protein
VIIVGLSVTWLVLTVLIGSGINYNDRRFGHPHDIGTQAAAYLAGAGLSFAVCLVVALWIGLISI